MIRCTHKQCEKYSETQPNGCKYYLNVDECWAANKVEIKSNKTSHSSPSDYYVVVLPCAAGNEEVGTMWNETKIVDENTTVKELIDWKEKKSGSKGDLIITKPST